MKILVSGSIAFDILMQYDGSFPDAIDPAHLDELSMAFVTSHYARHHGGTAVNIAWNLRLLNQHPLLVGTVGHDAGAYMALLEERGIETKRVEVIRTAATSTAVVATDSYEHQITFFHPGADATGTFPDLSEEREDLPVAIIGPRDARVMLQAVAWCKQYAVPFIFDPGQQVMSLGEEEIVGAIEASAGVIANAYEWSLISKRTSFSIEQLLEHAPFLIITQAEAGFTLYTKKGEKVFPACKADKIINPTGAGDAFRAGLVTGIAAKWPLHQGAQLGAALASFVVEQEGTLLDKVDLNDVLGRAEVAFGDVLPPLP